MSFYRTHTLTCTPSYTLTCTPSKLAHYGAASQGLFLTGSIIVFSINRPLRSLTPSTFRSRVSTIAICCFFWRIDLKRTILLICY
jgi:hypothetical protein